MQFSDFLSAVHWLPVIIMTVVSFALGAFWHSPVMFGKLWKKENNYNTPKEELNMPLIFGGTAVMHFVALTGLNAVISGSGALEGMLAGFLIAVVWVFTTLGGTYLFANRSVKLLLVDAGMYVVLFSLAGLVFGIW